MSMVAKCFCGACPKLPFLLLLALALWTSPAMIPRPILEAPFASLKARKHSIPGTNGFYPYGYGSLPEAKLPGDVAISIAWPRSHGADLIGGVVLHFRFGSINFETDLIAPGPGQRASWRGELPLGTYSLEATSQGGEVVASTTLKLDHNVRSACSLALSLSPSVYHPASHRQASSVVPDPQSNSRLADPTFLTIFSDLPHQDSCTREGPAHVPDQDPPSLATILGLSYGSDGANNYSLVGGWVVIGPDGSEEPFIFSSTTCGSNNSPYTLTDNNSLLTIYFSSTPSTYNVTWYSGLQLTITQTSAPGAASGSGLPSGTSTLYGIGTGGDFGPPVTGVGEPVCVSTGSVFEYQRDYETAGQNKLAFSRCYNSQELPFFTSYFKSPFGTNWATTYDRYIVIYNSNALDLVRSDGQILPFSYCPGAGWLSATDFSVSLTQNGSVWTFTDENDNVETYQTVGSSLAVLDAITLRNGYSQTLSFNANGDYSVVTDTYGRSMTINWSGQAISSVDTPDGTEIDYLTDGPSGTLSSVSYPGGATLSFQYLQGAGESSYLSAIVDENGNVCSTWSYDLNSNPDEGDPCTESAIGGAGSSLDETFLSGYPPDTSWGYNFSALVQNSVGESDTYAVEWIVGKPKVGSIVREYDGSNYGTRSYTYDSNGYLASETDFKGNLTQYVNDQEGRPTSITRAAGTSLAVTTTVSYFGTYHLPSAITAPNVMATFSYDSNGNILSKTLSDTSSNSWPYGTAGQTKSWNYTWSNGLLASIETSNGGTTAFSYDAAGALRTVTDARGHVTTVLSHTGGGYPLKVQDANGVITNYTYDGRQRLTSQTVITGTGPLTTTYGYDLAGNLTSVQQPDGSTAYYQYNSAHLLSGYSNSLGQSVSYTFDSLGDRIGAVVRDSFGSITSVESRDFDFRGWLTSDTEAPGQTTTFSWDDEQNLVGLLLPRGGAYQQTYDALNRRVTSTAPNGGITSYAYDQNDRLLQVVAPNGATTSYVYDGFGDLIGQQSPDTGATVQYFDGDGNVVKRIDARGSVGNYGYDALDRLTSERYPGDPAENVTYTYDEPGHGFGIGRLTTIHDAAGTLSRVYDERGLVTSETRAFAGGRTLVTTYSYDAAGRVASIGYPSGLKINYLRDAAGQVRQVSASGKTTAQIATIEYKPFGPVDAITFGNGVKEERTYNQAYRLQQITDATWQGLLRHLEYGFDLNDNVTSISDLLDRSESQAFRYDIMDRLIAAKGPYGSLEYSYDSVGNRLSEAANGGQTAYGYSAGSNRLTSVASGGLPEPVRYDAAGDITSINGYSLSYDPAGRLSRAATAGRTVGTYVYDAFGERLEKTAGGTSTFFSYDENGRLLEEKPSAGRGDADYIYLDDGRPLAVFCPSSRTLSYLQTDLIGAPQMATGESGSVVWQASYTPFGEGKPQGSITQNLRMPGQYYDAETGLCQNWFRDYAPGLGRYVESDPLGLTVDGSTYDYVQDDPLPSSDPTGLDPDINARRKSLLNWEISNDAILNAAELAGEIGAIQGTIHHGPSDCSGWIRSIYSALGVQMPPGQANDWRAWFEANGWRQVTGGAGALQPGDIIVSPGRGHGHVFIVGSDGAVYSASLGASPGDPDQHAPRRGFRPGSSSLPGHLNAGSPWTVWRRYPG